jgi:hypothetical protein
VLKIKEKKRKKGTQAKYLVFMSKSVFYGTLLDYFYVISVSKCVNKQNGCVDIK